MDNKKQAFDSTQRTGQKIAGSHYRKIRQNEPLYMIADIGNSDGKGMLHGMFGEEIIVQHSVWRPSTIEYNNLKRAYGSRKSDYKGTAIFEKSGQGYVVGSHARQSGKGNTIHGHAKYTPEQYGAMVLAMLLQLYPTGHEDVHLVLTHPAKMDDNNYRALWKSVVGVHRLKTVDGREVVYNVKKDVILIEESVAAFQTFTLNTRGKPYVEDKMNIAPSSEFFMIDIGSWISYMGMGIVNDDGGLEPNVMGASVIEVGIENVLETLEQELKSSFPDLSRLPHLPRQMLIEAIRDNQITIKGGVAQDCTGCVHNAMNVLIMSLSTDYNGKFKEAIRARGVVVSGGGGDLSFVHLCDMLLIGHNVHPAEQDSAHMRFGAIRGCSKGLFSFLKMEELEPNGA